MNERNTSNDAPDKDILALEFFAVFVIQMETNNSLQTSDLC